MHEQVDGIYDSDPKKNPHAKKYNKLSYRQCTDDSLRVMDGESCPHPALTLPALIRWASLSHTYRNSHSSSIYLTANKQHAEVPLLVLPASRRDGDHAVQGKQHPGGGAQHA